MDSDFYRQLVSFKIRHKKLLARYMNQTNDSLRNIIKDEIVNQMLNEKEILEAEIDYLSNEISEDSLWLVRHTSHQKY